MAESKTEAKQKMQKIKGDKLMRQLAKADRREYRRLRRIANSHGKNGNDGSVKSAPVVNIENPEIYTDLPGLITSQLFDCYESIAKTKDKNEIAIYKAVASALQNILSQAFNARDGKRHLELVSTRRKSA